MKIVSLTLISIFIIPSLAWAGSDIEIVPIKDHLHMLISPKGGNVIVSTGDSGTFIIDDQLETRSAAIKKAVASIDPLPVKFVLNTHYHFDHTGGNEAFSKDGALIVAHDNVRKRLSTKQFITYFQREMLPLSGSALPVVTFSSNLTLHYNDDDIRIIHVPNAHTDGDSVAYFSGQNVMVTGDTVFNGRYPFFDAEHGGSIKGLITGLNQLLALADDKTIIAPGHGNLMNKADLQSYKDILEIIMLRVEKSVAAGKSLEEVITERPSKEYDATMGQGLVEPDAFVTLIYKDIKGESL